ncbi:GNAT family N-acetyltransferase [Paenibacillus sp. YYML68]|uniref:GNAT family N-acetyltransferase n=1 Tax=Paenibacillus sp. YYML68 TaxID=2909250 RepID=UPI00248F9F7D|nr:GNAT family N-acetyltransferase [Paenibacillus sp. YYML68]
MSIERIDLYDIHKTLPLLELQQLAYRIEVERMRYTEPPPLLDSPLTLQQSGEAFLGYWDDERLVGAIAYRLSGRACTITRMMVHPDFFRQGIASRLLETIGSMLSSGDTLSVSTGAYNEPAVSLYRKHGFEPVEQQELAPGIFLTRFTKSL